jgi:hypothetical protein
MVVTQRPNPNNNTTKRIRRHLAVDIPEPNWMRDTISPSNHVLEGHSMRRVWVVVVVAKAANRRRLISQLIHCPRK